MLNLFSFINKQKCKIWTCVTTTKTLGIGLRSRPLSTSPSNIIKWCCAFTNNLVFNIKSTNIIDGVDDAHFIALVSISTILSIVLNFVYNFGIYENTAKYYFKILPYKFWWGKLSPPLNSHDFYYLSANSTHSLKLF